jgi:hypothetical protein
MTPQKELTEISGRVQVGVRMMNSDFVRPIQHDITRREDIENPAPARFTGQDERIKQCAKFTLRDYDLQNSFITSYEWRTLQSQQWTGYAEAVTGFLKIDTGNLESILKISGKHGVFFIEHLAQTRPSDVIEWIPQEKDEDDMDYFARVTSDAHTNIPSSRTQRLGAPYARRYCVNKHQKSQCMGSPRRSQPVVDWRADLSAYKARGLLFRAKHSTKSFCFAYENANGEILPVLPPCQNSQANADQSCRQVNGSRKLLAQLEW